MIKNIDPRKVAIYVRWSTDDQGKGHTLAVQLESCKLYVQSQGWKVNEDLIFIDDGYTGANLDRPGMIELRRLANKRQVDCIVFMKLDRLSRSVSDIANLVGSEWDDEVFVRSATEPFDTTSPFGKTLMYFLAIFAEWERETIRERTQGGKKKNAQNGKNPGFKSPYGYVSSDTPGVFLIVPEEAEIVQRIFQEYTTGSGVTSIGFRLNGEGIKFRKDKVWNESTIRHIVTNPIYTGRLVYGRLTRNSKRKKNPETETFWKKGEAITDIKSEFIPPIITDELYQKAQRVRSERDNKKDGVPSRAVSSPHLLTGLAKCTCGHNLVGRKATERDPAYYRCLGATKKGPDFCKAGYIRQDDLDGETVERFLNHFRNAERSVIKSRLVEQREIRLNEVRQGIKNLETEIADFEEQKRAFSQDYRKKRISVDRYNDLMDDIEREQKDIERNLESLYSEIKDIEATSGDYEEWEQSLEKLNEWDKLPIEQRKSILRRWIYSLKVFRSKSDKKANLEITYNWDKTKTV